MENKDIQELHEKGFCILENKINDNWIQKLKESLDKSFEIHKQVQIKHNSEIDSEGVALNVLADDDTYIKFLSELIRVGLLNDLKDHFFKSNFILNSFSALNNMTSKPNFSAIVHRDIRFFPGDFPMMINVLVFLDDFTEENGATYLLPYSHKIEEKPSDEYFFKNASRAIGKKGDILLFNSSVWHASGLNKTQNNRRAIPITFTKSFMKQLMDYPRALGDERIEKYSEEIKQLIGYYSRVPANLDEWYQPYENRFYKKNQD